MTGLSAGEKFSADRPIVSKSEDALDRGAFASELANAIKGWGRRDSLVIGLFGPWGSGKTSIKNLVLEELSPGEVASPAPQAVTVVEFNPWQWAAQGELAEAFFHEVELAIGRDDRAGKSKKLAAKWSLYAARLKVGTTISSGLPRVLAATLILLGALGLSLAPAGPPLDTAAHLVSAALVFVGLILGFSRKIAEALSSAFAARAEVESRSLWDVKRELADEMRGLAAPILVVIDDLDRLQPQEMREEFS